MRKTGILATSLSAIALAGALAVVPPAARAAEGDKTFVMKLSLATINDSQHEWTKMFVAAVEKDSGGRIKGEIYPASQLGSIPRQIEGVQFGSIQAYVGPPEFLVGIDERYEVMSAPGIVDGIDHGIRIATDPAVKALVLGLGADKGLHGIGLFISQPSAVIARTPIRHLADFKGKKLRVLAAQFQQEMLNRLGATPVAMTLGDVLPAIQQGALDGAVAVVTVYTTMQYQDAAKYVTETEQPFVFSAVYMSKKWYDTLPQDLQRVVDEDADRTATAINPWERNFYEQQRKVWTDKGGELISLPPQEQAAMMETIASVGDDLSKSKPSLHAAYEALVAAAKRTKP